MTATVGAPTSAPGAGTQTSVLGGLYRGQTVTVISSSKAGPTDQICWLDGVRCQQIPQQGSRSTGAEGWSRHSQGHYHCPEPSYRPWPFATQQSADHLPGRRPWGNGEVPDEPQQQPASTAQPPKITGSRYATATLNIRSTYTDKYKLITEVPAGHQAAHHRSRQERQDADRLREGRPLGHCQVPLEVGAELNATELARGGKGPEAECDQGASRSAGRSFHRLRPTTRCGGVFTDHSTGHLIS